MITLLNTAVEKYAYAKELFAAWQAQRERKPLGAAAVAIATDDKPESLQLEYLRYQIEMRVLGCGWDQYATRWSAKVDKHVGSVAHLKGLLLDIVAHEKGLARLKKLPTEACPPQTGVTDIGQLGTKCVDARDIGQRALFSAEELARKAELAMQRRAKEGTADSVEWAQPEEPPAFDQQLVGKRIEILWKYFDKITHEPTLIWYSFGRGGGWCALQMGSQTHVAQEHARSCPRVLCSGRGMRTPSSMNALARNGYFCCHRSGTPRPIAACIVGAMTLASMVARLHAPALPWTRSANACAALLRPRWTLELVPCMHVTLCAKHEKSTSKRLCRMVRGRLPYFPSICV